jgi:hypothetical protein
MGPLMISRLHIECARWLAAPIIWVATTTLFTCVMYAEEPPPKQQLTSQSAQAPTDQKPEYTAQQQQQLDRAAPARLELAWFATAKA